METEKKVFFRPVSTNEESKNGKVCSAGRKTTFLSRIGVTYDVSYKKMLISNSRQEVSIMVND